MHDHDENEKLDINSVVFDILGVLVFLCVRFVPHLDNNFSIVMYVLSYIFIGYKIFMKALKHLFKKDMFDENLLMVIATIGALCIGEYLEGVVVLLLYKIGEFLQDKALDRSKEKIKETVDIRAKYANLIIDGSVKEVLPQSLKIGDVIVIKNR